MALSSAMRLKVCDQHNIPISCDPAYDQSAKKYAGSQKHKTTFQPLMAPPSAMRLTVCNHQEKTSSQSLMTLSTTKSAKKYANSYRAGNLWSLA